MFRYPGGKAKLKKIIISFIGSYYHKHGCFENTCYVEPFFGGGAIGRGLFSSMDKIAINDYDIGISCFWHSVINDPEGLCKLIKSFKPSVENFHKFKNIFLEEDLRERVLKNKGYSFTEVGFMKMALHQISFSGLGVKSGGPLGGASQESKYKIDCRWNPDYMIKKIRRHHFIFDGMEVFENTCCCDDYDIFLKRLLAVNKNVFIYLDPPYYDKGPELYQFYFDDSDHMRLVQLLKSVECPWLLSYDNAEEIRELYNWAYIIELNTNCTINTKNGALKKKELLITNNTYKHLLNL